MLSKGILNIICMFILINMINEDKKFWGICVSQSQFNITVKDGTMIEVKIDKANNETIGIVHLFMVWLNIWIDIMS